MFSTKKPSPHHFFPSPSNYTRRIRTRASLPVGTLCKVRRFILARPPLLLLLYARVIRSREERAARVYSRCRPTRAQWAVIAIRARRLQRGRASERTRHFSKSSELTSFFSLFSSVSGAFFFGEGKGGCILSGGGGETEDGWVEWWTGFNFCG